MSAPAAAADPMVPERFRVVRHEPGDRRHLDAHARAARPPGAARVRARPVQHGLRVRRRRGPDLDQRRSRSSPAQLVHTVRAVGAATEAICAAKPGHGARASAGPFGSDWPVDAADGARRRDRRRRRRAGAACARSSTRCLPSRTASAERSCSTEAASRTSSSCRASSTAGAREDLEVRRHRRHRDAELAGAAWAWCPALIARAEFDAAYAVAFICGPEAMMRFSADALLERGRRRRAASTSRWSAT